jgi:diacylglycerol kinase family enzyme
LLAPASYDCRVARVVLIVNPFASGVTTARIEQVEEALRPGGEIETCLTDARGHAGELAAEAAERADAVVVFAGDGTYNEAINGAGGRVPLGFVPGGGASVFPRTLGLPRDPRAAAARIADALVRSRTRAVDLGRVNGRLFCFAAGIGLDAEVVRYVDALGRKADGRRPPNVAFVAAPLVLFARGRARLEPAFEIAGQGRAALLLVACGRPYTYAGRVAISLCRDGAGLEFVAPERLTSSTLPGLVLRLLRGTLPGSAGVLSGSGLDRLEVRCDRPLALQADGEDLGDVGEAVFEAERAALTVLV